MFGMHRIISSFSYPLRSLRNPASARRAIRPLTLVLLGLAGLSCADSSNYLYRPAENATSMTEGQTAARYTIPATAPKGDVRIASFGVQNVAQDENGPEWPALHVRMIVANDSGTEPWTVDTREVRVELRGDKPQTPAVVSADAGELPELHIPPGEERTLDLFYPLSDDSADASSVPAFDVLWKVHTGADVSVERTPFERLAIASNASVGYGMGYSPYWWSNPYYGPGNPMYMGPGMMGPGFGGPFVRGPGFSGPGMSAPSGGSRFYVHAHPSVHH